VYPAAIAGRGSYFHFDTATDEAVLVFQPSATIVEPTLLRVPTAFRYPAGLQVAISPAGVAAWEGVCPGAAGCAPGEAPQAIAIRKLEAWAGEELVVVDSPA
jgi:hypothetical protein